MPYISVSAASTIQSTVSSAFGTQTSVAASTVTILSKKDDGSTDTSDSSSVVVLTQSGVGSVIISSATVTVASGSATTTVRGATFGDVTLIASSSGKGSGTHTTVVTYNTFMYTAPTSGGGWVRPQGGAGGAGGGGGERGGIAGDLLHHALDLLHEEVEPAGQFADLVARGVTSDPA